ncbi:hypothetical protein FSP39_014901 [Pinctada imbricata]|uniref:Uncharacterized protein n=1 Tax=Pinctada imbricata TaxID=66713 RepID=A0AA88YIL0_PINIB|nr:hypothetical protein FSP39_014901 [Pinctada imbricata]
MDGPAAIAIVGIGCKFPGADNIQEFWNLLVQGEDHVQDIPKERFDVNAFYDANPDVAGKLYMKKAGLVKGFTEWDSQFYGIGEKEAKQMDPQQRFVLDCVHMAMEDGGITKEHMYGTNTGVYIGMMNDDYKVALLGEDDLINNYTVTGSNSSIISARVSYLYNLLGPSIVLDTACSSALVAIHLAESAMKSGDISMAICGGVSCVFNPETFISLSKARMASPTGKCQTFSKYADGYARGEGCGIIILKKLDKAIEDNNKIWGVIATGCNQDGRTTSPITAPSSSQQIALLEKVFGDNNICPSTIQYIEAHGTGTPVGDPIEANALGTFFSTHHQKKKTDIFIGSVKTNIGHLESAAGVAGLIKILLMMEHGLIVPSLHSKELNPKIEFKRYHLTVPQAAHKWLPLQNEERVACINSFGFGGTNSHAIVKGIFKAEFPQKEDIDKLHIITLSANDTAALINTAEKYTKHLQKSVFSLESLAYTATVRRDHFRFRTFVISKSKTSLSHQIGSRITDVSLLKPVPLQLPTIMFVFCGVGTAWQGMCKELLKRFAAFRNTVNIIDSLILPLTKWSIFEILESGKAFVNDAMINHIAIFTCQVALVHLWKSFGITPVAVIGQSVGEVAAAYTSGAISIEQAVSIIYHRSRLLAESNGGKMAVVRGVAIQEIESECKALKSGKVGISVYISSECCTVSGDEVALEELRHKLKSKGGMRWITLDVQCAYHSHFTKQPGQKLADEIMALVPKANQIPVFSSVTGTLITSKGYCNSHYWASNVTDAVKFHQALLASRESKEDAVYLEIGPSPVLRSHVSNIFPEEAVQVIPSMTKNSEMQEVLTATGTLYTLGFSLDWKNFFEDEPPPLADIPSYCFNSKPLFEESTTRTIKRSLNNDGTREGFLLGNKGTDKFLVTLSEQRTPYIFEHVIEESVIVPGALYGALGLELGKYVLGLRESTEVGWKIENPLAVGVQQSIEISVDVEKNGDRWNFKAYDAKKQILSSGVISKMTESIPDRIDIREHKERICRKPNDDFIYKTLRNFGFQHGPLYQIVRKGLYSKEECFGEVLLSEKHLTMCNSVDMHPIIIDSMLQCCCSFLPFYDIPSNAKLFPVGIGKLLTKQKINAKMYIYSRVLESDSTNFLCNAILCQENGIVVAEMLNIQTKILNMSLNGQDLSLCYNWNSFIVGEEIQSKQKSEVLMIARKRNTRDFLLGKTNSDILCLDDFSDFDVTKETILSKNSSIVVYLPGYLDEHLDNKDKYEEILSDGHFLLQITRAFSHRSIRIVIITEATQNLNLENQAVNLLGSELWGMVRSIAMEPTKLSFRLIDTYPNVQQNWKSIESLLTQISDGDDEIPFETCLIDGEIMYGCIQRMLPQNTSRKASKQKIPDCKQKDRLGTGSSEEDTNATKKRTQPNIAISVSKVCSNILDSFTSQNSNTTVAQIWRNDNRNQIQMPCVEFLGSTACHHGSKKELICCYPWNLRPQIDVPKNLVCPKDDIPFYSLGMFQTCILAITIAEYTDDKKSVVTIANEEGKGVVYLLKQLLNKKKIQMWQMSDMKSADPKMYRKSCLLLLTSNENHELDSIEGKCFSKIILFDRNCRFRFDGHGKTEFVFLSSDHIFSLNNISKKIRDAKRCLKELGRQEFPVDILKISDNKSVNDSLLNSADQSDMMLVRENSSYIVVGGLTGLGWLLVKHLARCRAKKIVIFSRRNPDDEMKVKIQRLNNFYGVHIVPMRVDICNLQDVLHVLNTLKTICRNEPIRGIFHGAAVTSDKFAQDMTMDQYEVPLRPKILGTLNLDSATKDLDLDYFVTHSSIAALFGNVGQCNYAAGNAFQDCFALHRKFRGLPATSIIWGALDTGLVSDEFTKESLRTRGFVSLKQQQIIDCINIAMTSGDVHRVFAHIDWRAFLQNDFKSQRMKFKDFLDNSIFSISSKQTTTHNMQGDDEKSTMDMVLECLAGVFALHQSQISTSTPIVEYGLDSQKGTELASLIFDKSKVRVPYIYLATEDHSAADIAEFVKKRQEMGISADMSSDTSKLIFDSKSSFNSFMEGKLLDDNDIVYHEIHLIMRNTTIQPSMIEKALQHMSHLHPSIRTMFYQQTDNDGKITLRREVKEEEEDVLLIEVNDEMMDQIHIRDIQCKPVKIDIYRHKEDITINLMVCPILFDTSSVVCLVEESIELVLRFENAIGLNSLSGNLANTVQLLNFDDFLDPDVNQSINFWKLELKTQMGAFPIGYNKMNHGLRRTTVRIPDHSVNIFYEKLAKIGMGKFQAMCCFAQLGLAIVTKASTATILAQTDMRPFVGIDDKYVGFCSNFIPFIMDFSPLATISLHELLSRSVRKLKSMEKAFTIPFHHIKALPEFDESKHQNVLCMFLDETSLKESEKTLRIKEYRTGFTSLAKIEVMVVSSGQHLSLFLTSIEDCVKIGEDLLKVMQSLIQLYVCNSEISLEDVYKADFRTGRLGYIPGRIFVLYLVFKLYISFYLFLKFEQFCLNT